MVKIRVATYQLILCQRRPPVVVRCHPVITVPRPSSPTVAPPESIVHPISSTDSSPAPASLLDAAPAAAVEHAKDIETLRLWLVEAMSGLNDRERFIVQERKLRDTPRTLDSLGTELGLSKERVRQLEAAAFAKMRKMLDTQSKDVQEFFV